MKKPILCSFVAATFVLCAHSSQQRAPVEWIPVSELGDNMFHMAQRTADARLLLTPNESFFPKLGLLAEGEGELPVVDPALNKGTNYKWISGWESGDAAEWGLWIEKPGTLSVQIDMEDAKGTYVLSLSGQEQNLSGKPLSFKIGKSGMHVLRITCKDEAGAAKLHAIKVSGAAAENAAVLRKRWRPAAAHTRFSSSHDPEGVRLVIMEMDAKPGTLDFYAPITTPFGYYGPTWKANGLVNTGFNFSLWSFGRGKEEPPIEKLSHLIAIGDPNAKFSGFSHEGTGVKIRGWNPLEGRPGQRQAFAIRMEPGETYTTYFTYFFATDENRWRMFGVGKTWNKRKPKDTLGIGSFVEVPGPPTRQRTGPYERRMRYRGWVVDGKGKLHPYDRMSEGDIDKATGLTHTDRGLTDDGWFYLQTGGWAFRKTDGKEPVVLPPKTVHRVGYLSAADLKFLQTVPCEIAGTGIKQTSSGAKVSFSIRNLGKNPEVKIYWGEEEGLTFSDRWKNSIDVKKSREGANSVMIDAPAGKPLFVRLFLKNGEGQFWSMDTLKIQGQ
ncbi:DUF3472 domain-containing protein [Pontiella sulfatireligans]|uniref:Uncharacterized protein n=1 Tax=Pontiella sulfatireligans TaxID=2750658 RepID=A0A6C2UKQ5_9BACT|nr:DUF3472 domain-containing protein [Pontiella sulfatireligans]VGO20820.1 hypothetical protein SCARR_02887 [Pontiella sulfatireligans]